MKLIRIGIIGLLALLALQVSAQKLVSPDGNLVLELQLKKGVPTYQLSYKGKTIIESSRLGLEMEEASLSGEFTQTDVKNSSLDETWSPVWGEYAHIRNHYNEMAVTLVQKHPQSRTLLLRFRLFDDGLGFRYELPVQNELNYLTVKDELTEFNLTGNHTFFCIPGDYDTNEFAYTTAPLSEIKEGMKKNLRKKGYESPATSFTVQTPLMMKTAGGVYINIHEAALVDYSAMLLNVDDEAFRLSAHLTPDKLGKKGYLQLPCQSPWRTIIVSDDARDILASQLILNLNEPCRFEDTSWIKPLKFVGVWWEMFTGDGKTWAYSDYYKAKPGVTDYKTLSPNGHHPANTAHVKEYIDFAAEQGIDAVLVEGWNEGWEDWASYRKERQFLFNKPYPDFDVKELQQYAAARGVRIMMHHETSANAADYERQMDQAFQYMVDNGYNAVKTGYVGYIIPRSEYHSSQWMNNHYIHVAKRAADFKIMVNSHEAVRPTGLCRTYPNWLAQESARGGEFESMGGNDPDHTTILPFTRLKGGPMDYTPGIFETRLSYYGDGKKNERVHTTLVKQLALYVTMPSPVQMAADLPSNYRRFMDAFQFIKEVPVDWADSHYLEAEPGDYITVARKAKDREEWFIGAITDENPRTAVIPFRYLSAGRKYVATIYEDGKDADWDVNPQSYRIRKVVVTNKSLLKQKLASSGGVAISLKEATKESLKGLKEIK
ncbi:glycoside hydrolase family 97 protein [Bacteroides nordii]|uniref:glycoside hydrolase family 97 protein n=1 Tax=Bacteroides TaxID=816 RepID=UPI00036B55ED|nr:MULTISPECIES: glycoside hydrolase family 97 protein [Bacteroides]EOA59020.1 alpha-glucosidase [Bacteroides sp. HPS0048]UAK43162.1 glycoside hydrolase family 97 protein [Bacteroides nordii]